MALWGNNDNVDSVGAVVLNYSTGVVTGTGTSFGQTGSAQEGDVIRFGTKATTYYGDAVIVSIASTIQCTIGSTMALSGAAIGGVQFGVSQLPKSSILDSKYSESNILNNPGDNFVYGVANAEGVSSEYQVTHEGWVGVTTYVDTDGNFRVKKETLVAMSGITTGTTDYPTPQYNQMLFNELNEKNFLLFAIKHYQNPQAVTREDFDKDLNHFRYIKRLLKRYKSSGELRTHLLINHFIILYNVFGDATTPMLFYKVDKDLWDVTKTFIVFLDRLPEYPKTTIHDIEMDQKCLEELRRVTNG